MPQAMTDAIPLMESDGTTGRNNARDIRMQLITPLLLPDALGTGIRNGVLPRTWSSTLSQYTDLKVTQLASPGQAVQIQPGRLFLTRSGQGPYILTQESAVASYAMDTADPTNARIDVIYARLYDAAIGDGGFHGPRLEHVNGTPAGSPVAPSVPSGAIALAQVLRPAGVNNVTDANITDLRKGTALHGAPRLLLPGDSLADPGLFVGERQVRMNSAAAIAAGGAAWNEYRWCGDSTWKPMELGSTTMTHAPRDGGNVTSTSYTATRASAVTPVGTQFVAPNSGKVEVSWACGLDHNTLTTAYMLCSFRIGLGSTVDGGAQFGAWAANDDWAIMHYGTDEEQQGRAEIVSGLTPGTVYNLSLRYRGATTASFLVSRVSVSVKPVW